MALDCTYCYASISSSSLVKQLKFLHTSLQKMHIAYPLLQADNQIGYIISAICSFNGKEKDHESGFHYYGARYYWSEVLTGWLSVDPMADKYPNISPYNYCLWNPIAMVDPNGENGKKIIDKQLKTITVKATYYVTSVPISPIPNTSYTEDEIRAMQIEINSTLNSGNYQYEYNGEKFDVIFDLEFISSGTEIEAMNAAEADPYGNYFSKLPASIKTAFPTRDNGDGTVTVVGGITNDNKRIVMNAKYDNNRRRIHEIFHTLFFNDDNAKRGIGNYTPGTDLPNQDDINKLLSNPMLEEEQKEI